MLSAFPIRFVAPKISSRRFLAFRDKLEAADSFSLHILWDLKKVKEKKVIVNTNHAGFIQSPMLMGKAKRRKRKRRKKGEREDKKKRRETEEGKTEEGKKERRKEGRKERRKETKKEDER